MTVSSDVQVRVRAADKPLTAVNGGQNAESSAYTRAIPREWAKRQRSKVRNSVSLHVVEARDATLTGWGFTEALPTAGDMWRQVLPAKGEAASRTEWTAMTAAGLFRAVVITVLWTVGLSVATRKRAAVGLAVVVLLVIVGVVALAVS